MVDKARELHNGYQGGEKALISLKSAKKRGRTAKLSTVRNAEKINNLVAPDCKCVGCEEDLGGRPAQLL